MRYAGKWLFATTLLATILLPVAAGGSWTRLGPEGGAISSVAIDPIHTGLAYAVAQSGGGLFRSVDSESSWIHVSFRLNGDVPSQSDPRAYSVVADPLEPYRVWVVSDAGLLRSRDAGQNWEMALANTLSDGVMTVAPSPIVPDRIFAGVWTGLLESDDGGDSWRKTTLPGAATLLVFDPHDSSVLFAVDQTNDPIDIPISYVYKSLDAGATWILIPWDVIPPSITSLVADPGSPSTFFIATWTGVLRSVDGGVSWKTTALTSATDFLAFRGNDLIAGEKSSGELFASKDRGDSWESLPGAPGGGFGDLSFDPRDPSTALVGTSAGYPGYSSPDAPLGVYKSSDGGATWGFSSSGIRAAGFTLLAVDPSDSDTLYGSIDMEKPARLLKSKDGGITWAAMGISDVWLLVVDLADGSTLYAGTHSGVKKSTDGGVTWSATGLPVPVYALAIDPNRRGILYAGTESGLLRTIDGGVSWSPTHLTTGFVQSVAFDPFEDGTIFAAVWLEAGQSAIYRSTDSGFSWPQKLSSYGLIGGFYFDASARSDLYTLGGLRSTDGGSTWAYDSREIDGFPVQAAGDSLGRAILLVIRGGQDILRSDDGGSTWISYSQGVEVPDSILSMRLDSTRIRLYATSTDGALWTFSFEPGRSISPIPSLPVSPIAGR